MNNNILATEKYAGLNSMTSKLSIGLISKIFKYPKKYLLFLKSVYSYFFLAEQELDKQI